jgi:hypothetical protein
LLSPIKLTVEEVLFSVNVYSGLVCAVVETLTSVESYPFPQEIHIGMLLANEPHTPSTLKSCVIKTLLLVGSFNFIPWI